MSGMSLMTTVVLFVLPCAALARNHTSSRPPRSHSESTARSSGPSLNHRNEAIRTGSQALGAGDTKPSPSADTDAAVQAENEVLNRKLKSICRGC
jgi:hypothetical protein